MNNYQIYDEIGKGRFSRVYKGRRKKTIDYYAISSIDKSQRQRVLTNVKFLRSANHPRIIQFNNWYETNNHLWVITELCTGGDMKQILAGREALSEPAVRLYGGDIAEGLLYIHSRGVVYRNLKPSNILMDSTMTMRFYDFSISCDFSAVRREGTVGTAMYMAPELFTKEGVPSMSSDLWAFGCLLHEMATGKPPFEASDIESLIMSIMTEPVPHQEGLCDELNDLIQILLVKDPFERATWEDVVASSFWKGELKLATHSLPPQPGFEAFRQLMDGTSSSGGSGMGNRWPMSVADARKHMDWVLDNVRRNYMMGQSGDGAANALPGVMDEIDTEDHGVHCEASSPTTTSSVSVASAPHNAESAALSQPVRNKEWMNKEEVAVDEKNAGPHGSVGCGHDPTFPLPVEGGRPADVTIDELLMHSSDAHIRPLVMNSRIERFVEQKYDIEALGFEPPKKSDFKTLDERAQAQFVTTVYKLLSSHSHTYEEKFNVLCYFETVCREGSIANFVVNSSVMTLCLKLAAQRKASSSFRATAASIMGILVRHATFIHSDLAKSGILTSILRVYSGEESYRVKRKLVACLGEFLIYIAVQQERDRAVWGIEPEAFLSLYQSILVDVDDVLKHYGVKTIENLASVNDQRLALDMFANWEIISALLSVYALPPSPTFSEHMRTGAICAALKLALLREEFIPKVLDSKHLRPELYGAVLTGATSTKSAQALLTFINVITYKGLVVTQHPSLVKLPRNANIGPFTSSSLPQEVAQSILSTVSGVADAAVRGLCEGACHATAAIKGKTLILLILLGFIDERFLLELLSSACLVHVEGIVRDRDSYVQRCVGYFASFLSTFMENQLANVSSVQPLTRHDAVLSLICDIMSVRNLPPLLGFSGNALCSVGKCLTMLLKQACFSTNEANLHKLVELLAQDSERIVKQSHLVASELLPPYLSMLTSHGSERRFSSLRVLSALVAVLADVPVSENAACNTGEHALDRVMRVVCEVLPELLDEGEPIPVHAIRLLASCGEHRPSAFAHKATIGLVNDLVHYMVQYKQSDISAPLQLLMLTLQTAGERKEIANYLLSRDVFVEVLHKTLVMAIEKEIDYLLEPCCDLSVLLVRHAIETSIPQLVSQCFPLLSPHGIKTLWLPLCTSPVHTAAPSAATCVSCFVEHFTEARRDFLSVEGMQHVRQIIETSSNQDVIERLLRALRCACKQGLERDQLGQLSWLPALLEVAIMDGRCNAELASDVLAVIQHMRARS
ncbi:Protein kinase domain [Trypanosoma vivax]|nr:Protein kinase domain [Trypanosoma vivax]